MTSQKIIGRECRFAVYIPPAAEGQPDYHLVKEILHFEDGSIKPNLLTIPNYKRPFWVANTGCRNYKSKREWTPVTELIKYESTQSELHKAIPRALGTPWITGNLRKVSESPYLYGSDIASTALIKQKYLEQFPTFNTRYSVAVFDTETNMLNDEGEIIMASVTYKNTVFTAVCGYYLEGLADVQNRVDAFMNKYLGDVVKARNIKSELVIVENSIEVVRACMNKAHELRPDFMAIWNIDFDIQKVLQACEKHQVDPKDIFSDPGVPKANRFFEYKQGKSQKITASGKVIPINWHARWHTVFAPCSFYFVDAACVYKQARVGRPEEQSYSLNSILDLQLGIRKLSFTEADHLQDAPWHVFMQTYHKLEYIIYNRFDCISMEMLDEKTNDLSLTMPLFSGPSDFKDFASQPKRKVDELHFFVQKLGYIIGSTGAEMGDDYTDDVIGLGNIIVALPAELVTDSGLQIIEEYPELTTSIRGHTGD